MPHQTNIQRVLDRMAKAFQARPTSAQDVTRSRAVLKGGFTTVTQEGDHQFTLDMPEAAGGSGAGPTPGVLGRACIAGCVAMGVRIAAARRAVAIEEIAVDLSMDWDNRGLFGLDGVSAGPAKVRLEIQLKSDAPEALLRETVAEGLRHDPWLIALTDPHDVATDITIAREA